jgi:hypothetical protein
MFLEKHSGSGNFKAGQKVNEARLQIQPKSPKRKGTDPNIQAYFKGLNELFLHFLGFKLWI